MFFFVFPYVCMYISIYMYVCMYVCICADVQTRTVCGGRADIKSALLMFDEKFTMRKASRNWTTESLQKTRHIIPRYSE